MAIAPLTSMLEPLLEWDPFRPLTLWDRPSRQIGMEAGAVADARVDWIETNDSHVFKADLPGMRKEDIKVQVEDGNVLTISGEKKREQQEQTDRFHRMERSYGRFERRFRLPADSKMDEVKAQVDHGVLTVTVPKIPEKKPEVKAIDISG